MFASLSNTIRSLYRQLVAYVSSRIVPSIRTQLLLLIVALMLIPFMGYTYVNQMRAFMLQGQEDALKLTARAISTVLHDRVELFNEDTGVPDVIGDSNDLFAYQLSRYLQLDGQVSDWDDQIPQARVFFSDTTHSCTANYAPQRLQFTHMLGYRGQYLYALFDVADSELVLHDPDSGSFTANDHIRVTIQDPLGIVRRYLITGTQAGRLNVYLMDEQWRNPVTGEPVYEFAAVLQPSADGYVVEIRFPRYLIGSNTGLSFTIVDVDDEISRQVSSVLSTAPGDPESPPGRVRIHSPELTKILRGIDKPVARIWILDDTQQVRAVVGRLNRVNAIKPYTSEGANWRSWLAQYFDQFANFIIAPPASEFEDIPTSVSDRPEEVFAKVLQGRSEVQRRPSVDTRSEILMAAEPIWLGDSVMGAVVVEQSGSEILTLQHRLLRNITLVTLLVFTFVTLALLYFAWRLTYRIRRLRNEADQAISPEGRVLQEHIATDTQTGDEIGDLARSMSGMLGRLSQYTRYLEAMPDTLAHEMSNPLNVVNSSLENLQKEVPQTQNSKYLHRAMNGINRLGTIMGNLTEAANLEEAINAEEPEIFDITALVSSYIEGYQQSHPSRAFELNVIDRPLRITGVPDHIAQMLDKLVDNALDFGDPASAVLVTLQRDGARAKLSVENDGPPIPEHLGARLFEPMVSVRHKNAKRSHLGLGLYIVRLIVEFHQGSVDARPRNVSQRVPQQANNTPESQGAIITVSIPLTKA